MSCNCNDSTPHTVQASQPRPKFFSKFGRCQRCMLLTVIGLLSSLLLLVPALILRFTCQCAVSYLFMLPFWFFLCWSILHVIGYWIHAINQRRGISDQS